MKKKRKCFYKRIGFGKQPLVVFSREKTHPITGFTLNEFDERVDFDFLDELAPKRKHRGRPPMPFKPMCKMMAGFYCLRLPSISELSRRLKTDKTFREFCGFAKGKTPSKQKISEFLINLKKETKKKIFSEFNKQLLRVEYVSTDTIAVDSCVYKTVNERPDQPKIEKRNNETGRMKKVHGIKQPTAVSTKTMVCTGFITDFVGRHDTIYYNDVLDETANNGYDFDYTVGDKGFDSTQIRLDTLLRHGAKAIIPKREYKTKKKQQKNYRQRRRNLIQFIDKQEDKKYDERTAVERYFSKIENVLGLSRLKTRHDHASESMLTFAICFDTICRTTHLYKTLENAHIPFAQ
jgi:transposase